MKFALIKNKGKNELFHVNDLKIEIKDTVLFNDEKGIFFGQVLDLIEDKDNQVVPKENYVIRVANKKDYNQYLINEKDAKNAIKKCRELVKKYNLNMSIIDAEYSFNRNQLYFKFTSNERVDFRQLAKELGTVFKTRIELRQIGIRDKAKEVGGLGVCGKQLCCKAFLKEFESVSISMAKNQSIALNPSKINGVCGRLLCCLKYEENVYEENIKKLPKIGSTIETKQGNAKVISRDILNMTIKVKYANDDILEIKVDN